MREAFESLVAAILRDDQAGIKSLLKEDATLPGRGADVACFYPEIVHWIYKGDTALHVSAAAYRTEAATLLLAAGASPAAARSSRRAQPLHYASDGHDRSPGWSPQGQSAMIRLLLKAGADKDARDANGATPLHRAVRTRCAAAVKVLLECGADLTRQNNAGSTPFHLAVQNTGRGGSGSEQSRAAQREIIALFREFGLKPTLKDGAGRTVLEWARTPRIRELLQTG